VSSYFATAQPEEASAALRATLQHLYRLPERLQLAFRTVDYLYFQQKPEQALKTALYRVELYPKDVEGRELLANLYNNRGEWDAKIAELEAILAIEPNRYEVMQEIGDAYERQALWDEALSWYGRYAELFPNDYQSSLDIGDLHLWMGAHDQARGAFERALLVEPGEVEVLTRLLRLETNLGDFEAAQKWVDEALAASRGPEDRADVYQVADLMYYRQGRFGAAIENYRELIAAIRETGSALAALDASDEYALLRAHEVGQEAWAYRQLDSLRASIAPPLDAIHGLGYAMALASAGDVQRARAELLRATEGIESGSLQVADYLASWAEGRIHENEDDCRSAVDSYRQALALRPAESNIAAELGRCQRKLGELEDAEVTLQEVLKVQPGDAKTRAELGLVYEGMGRRTEAIEQLAAATSIWKDADADYIPARDAETKLAEVIASR
jgi:tetratricopeptide (TPR) repeat protein